MGDKISVSYGYGIEKNKEYDIKHLCDTTACSSGGPILNLSTNKVIGIHKGFIQKIGKNIDNTFNIGTFLKFPLNVLNINNSLNNSLNNSINNSMNGSINNSPNNSVNNTFVQPIVISTINYLN